MKTIGAQMKQLSRTLKDSFRVLLAITEKTSTCRIPRECILNKGIAIIF